MSDLGTELPPATPPDTKAVTGLYLGPTEPKYFARGISSIDGLITETGESVDSLMLDRLKDAVVNGRSEVTVIDIGSGDGFMMKDLKEYNLQSLKLKAFLVDNPGLRLNVIGLTDSQEPNLQDTEKPIAIDYSKIDSLNQAINQQINVKNFYYTLSRTQSLEAFLDSHGINTVDLAFAIESLRYLGPKVFEEVVSTTISRIPQGGRFVGTGFTGSHPGYRGISSSAVLNIRNIPEGINRKAMLDLANKIEYFEAAKRKASQPGNAEEEEKALDEAINTLKRLDVLTDDEITEEEEKVKERPLNERERFYYLGGQIMKIGLSKLRQREYQKLDDQKQHIIANLSGVSSKIIRDGRGFSFTKN